ncbi:hypothetical protein D3C78_1949180 [compost metagenome]
MVSSTCIKVASDRPIVVSTRLGGVNDAWVLMVNPLQILAPQALGRANQRWAVLPAPTLLSWIKRAIISSASCN